MTDQILQDQPRVLVLEPGRAERHYWRHLWAYREPVIVQTRLRAAGGLVSRRWSQTVPHSFA